jgi:biopolymer transport protein ExbB
MIEDNAESPATGSQRLTDMLRRGGPMMIPLVACSVLLMVLVFERMASLRRRRIVPQPFARKFIEQLREGQLDRQQALALCDEQPSPAADILRACVLKWGKSSVEIEQAAIDAGERVSNHLRRFLRLINGIYSVAPLLGLLGTVFGLVSSFDAMANVAVTDGDPKVLISVGISEALLTTAAGLCVAIPALAAYLFFAGRVDQRIIELDRLGQQVVDIISAEGQADARARGAAATQRRARQVA